MEDFRSHFWVLILVINYFEMNVLVNLTTVLGIILSKRHDPIKLMNFIKQFNSTKLRP